jgi:hypothetical protein
MQENQPFQQSPPFLLESLENSEFLSEFFSELFSLNFIQRRTLKKNSELLCFREPVSMFLNHILKKL